LEIYTSFCKLNAACSAVVSFVVPSPKAPNHSGLTAPSITLLYLTLPETNTVPKLSVLLPSVLSNSQNPSFPLSFINKVLLLWTSLFLKALTSFIVKETIGDFFHIWEISSIKSATIL